MKVFVFDNAKCNGCYGCQVACKDEHVGNDWSPIARPQPDTGQFWLKLHEKTHGQAPKVRVEYWPVVCMHCDNPACKGAADGAIHKRKDGLVILDPEKAKGNEKVAEACPYGAIYWNDELGLPQKCTGCAHLVDEGKLPHCVDLCATGAWRFGDDEDFKTEIANAEILKPEVGTAPRVYYLNMPKLFLGGDVWDPADDEVIIGAEITLVDEVTGASRTTTSDNFGDFWFKRLDAGRYTLHIRASGYGDFDRTAIILDKSLNIRDIPLTRKHD